MGYVGSSDHDAVLAEITFKRPRSERFTRKLYKWEAADWHGMRAHLTGIDWKAKLSGSIDNQIDMLTSTILDAQDQYVPHTTYEARTADQPWFGVRCKLAARNKYAAWRKLKSNPSEQNRTRHREACTVMKNTQRWAINQWSDDTRRKIESGSMGSKVWWSLIKISKV